MACMRVPTPDYDPAELPMRYWQHSGVPRRHAEALDAIVNPTSEPQDDRHAKWQRALEAVRQGIGGNGIVALLGGRGTGKTQLAGALIREWCLTRGIPALYRRLGDVYGSIRATFSAKEISEESIMARLSRAGLLVLDECHERAGSDFESRVLTRLVDDRYAARKPTLLISNELPDAFAESIGSSIADRLREDGKIIVCQWPSFRAKLSSIVQTIE